MRMMVRQTVGAAVTSICRSVGRSVGRSVDLESPPLPSFPFTPHDIISRPVQYVCPWLLVRLPSNPACLFLVYRRSLYLPVNRLGPVGSRFRAPPSSAPYPTRPHFAPPPIILRPRAAMLDGVKVESYGSMSPLASVAQASMKGPQLIVLTLYDPGVSPFLPLGECFSVG